MCGLWSKIKQKKLPEVDKIVFMSFSYVGLRREKGQTFKYLTKIEIHIFCPIFMKLGENDYPIM